jgi:pyocin large subunit-like protein
MAANIKHVGRLKTNNRKAIVAFRVIPEDPLNCLVVMTESLEAGDHDALISLVDSTTGQTEYELGSAMMRTKLPDGSNMLARFSATGKLMKMPTSEIEMTPNFQSSVNLAELNQIMADNKGVTVADLAVKDPNQTTTETAPVAPVAPATNVAPEMTAMDEALNTAEQPMTDEVMAASLRSQADAMFKEAKSLREQAEELVPTKRKTKSKESA